jgi:hypothetical protein
MSLENPAGTGSLHVDAETQRRIESYARAAGRSTAEIVREAFDQYEAAHNGAHPEREESAFDVLHRAGLIGCVKGTPDAATDLRIGKVSGTRLSECGTWFLRFLTPSTCTYPDSDPGRRRFSSLWAGSRPGCRKLS